MLSWVQFSSLWRWNICCSFFRPKSSKISVHMEQCLSSNHTTVFALFCCPFWLQIRLVIQWMLNFLANSPTIHFIIPSYGMKSYILLLTKHPAAPLYLRLIPCCAHPQTTSWTLGRSTPIASSSDYTDPLFISINPLYKSKERAYEWNIKLCFCIM